MTVLRHILNLTVSMLPMSRNQRDRMHWRDRGRERDDWRLLIPQCPLPAFQAPDRIRRVTVTFTKTRGPLSDPDNLHARCKVVLDGLVFRNWIIDDSPKHVELEVVEEIGVERGTTIEVSEARG